MALKGPTIYDFQQNSGVVTLIFGPFTTYQLFREGEYLKYLCLIVGMGRRGTEMMIYANILESLTNLIGSEIGINEKQS